MIGPGSSAQRAAIASRAVRAGGWLALAAVAAVFLTYAPVWNADFIWDDDLHLTKNPTIVGPLGLKDVWLSSEANYFPLTMTTFWLQHALWGLNPSPYHLVTIALHALSGWLLWQVLRALPARGAGWGAACWTFHPVQVDSVAWISELKNTQSAVFFLASAWFFLRWLDTGSAARPADVPRVNRYYFLTLGCAGLAILSKTSTVMLPVVLGLCWWWRSRTWSLRWLVPMLPLFTLSAAAAGWTIWEQRFGSGAIGAPWEVSWGGRIAVASQAPWFYLAKLIWPQPLMFVYPRWDPAAISWGAVAALVGAGGALMFGGGFRAWRGARAALFGFGYFIALLFPVLGFFDVYYFRYSWVADHFQYLASMGPCALAGAAAHYVIARGVSRWRTLPAVAAVAAMAGLSCLHARGYRDEWTLWQTTLARNPTAPIALNNLGRLYAAAGDRARARDYYAAAVQQDPGFAEAHNNLGGLLAQEPGQSAQAIAHFEAALKANPAFFQARNNLAVELARDPARRAEAIAQYELALQLEPDSPELHHNLGLALADSSGRAGEAVAHLRRAVALNPGFLEARLSLARELGKSDATVASALEHFGAVIREFPRSAEAHNDLANVLARIGRTAEAVTHYEQALRLRPAFAIAHFNLAVALTAQPGKLDEAARHYERAIAAEPNFAVAHYRLARLLEAQPDRHRDARFHYEQAIRLDPNLEDARRRLAALPPDAP